MHRISKDQSGTDLENKGGRPNQASFSLICLRISGGLLQHKGSWAPLGSPVLWALGTTWHMLLLSTQQ